MVYGVDILVSIVKCIYSESVHFPNVLITKSVHVPNVLITKSVHVPKFGHVPKTYDIMLLTVLKGNRLCTLSIHNIGYVRTACTEKTMFPFPFILNGI